jgi:beta-lactamase class D
LCTESNKNTSNSNNLSEFLSGLSKTESEILKSQEKLQSKPKQFENYLIAKTGHHFRNRPNWFEGWVERCKNE